ncbi:MAG: F0F1 ATP synthase subunit A [Candidatus Omnitrophota bacterium]|jgi:F-type H+-transporting ATPase subunit a
MSEAVSTPELPNIITLIEHAFKGNRLAESLVAWENIIFSLIVAGSIALVMYLACRKNGAKPGRLWNACEAYAEAVDDFVCGILGPKGRKYTPFIGTLFIYILCMNLMGLIPLMKSPTSSWSITLALALCVFVYVQYTTLKELGFLGFIDHLMGNPRGILAFSVIIPIMMFFIHLVAELVRPISLSLRLRSNIWGDDVLLAVLAGFGLKGVPILFFNTLLSIVAALVQSIVFCLLTTIYFALVIVHEESHAEISTDYKIQTTK